MILAILWWWIVALQARSSCFVWQVWVYWWHYNYIIIEFLGHGKFLTPALDCVTILLLCEQGYMNLRNFVQKFPQPRNRPRDLILEGNVFSPRPLELLMTLHILIPCRSAQDSTYQYRLHVLNCLFIKPSFIPQSKDSWGNYCNFIFSLYNN